MRIEAPLTPVQAGMIYESTLAGQPGVNLEQIVIHLGPDELDGDALIQSWQAVADRHPALRSVADWSAPGGAVQVINPQARFDVFHKDWSDLDEAAAKDRLAAFLDEDRALGADPSAWPNWRLTLIRMVPQPVVVWTFSHSFLDGRSFAMVLEEVFARFDALRRGEPAPVPEQRPEPFAHYRAANHVRQETVDHFAAHLANFEAPNEVGLSLAAEAVAPPRKPVLDLEIPATATRRIAEVAARSGSTLGTALNAAWALVLARTSGRAEAVFGLTRSGRHLVPQSPRMLGCLINTVPLSVRVVAGQSLDDLLRQVRSTQLAMRPHEHCPLTEIRNALALPGDRPMFRSMLIYDRETLDARMQILGGAWQGRRVELHEQGDLPLTLAAYGEDRLLLRLEYDPAQIAHRAAERYVDYLHRILDAMASADEDMPLADLPMLPPEELAALTLWSQGEAASSAAPSDIPAALRELAKAQPDAPAVVTADGAVQDFAGLAGQVDFLAAHFAGRGAGPGKIVALCLPRSPDYIAAMLAVLKTGAAFLPLDPVYPAESLGYMTRDSGAMLLVTRRIAPWMTGYPVLDLADLGPAPTLAHHETAAPAADPQQDAYVIYTSGTTGRPKGVAVPVRALAAHSAAARDWLSLTADDRVLQFTSLSFDVSIEEIVPTLLAGAAVVLRSDAAARDPQALLDLVRAQGVTVLNLPTGYWQALLDDMELSGARLPASVRLVIAGGERVPPQALQRWRALQPDVDWINGYGPTEATITSAAYILPAGRAMPAGDVPVGRPLAHARLYILAPDHSPTPPGCVGALWIGGPCVANGYVNRPELTAEKFVESPRNGPGRLYASGDLARWDADGMLRLGGRADRQIKLRGFRIEPAEIERVLEGLEDVGQAVVSALDLGTPTARLVAWIRPAVAGDPLDAKLLETTVAGLLPPQMRPRIVPVTDWPMRPGGKIDIARLPRPEDHDPVEADHGATDETTRQIAALFAELLRVPAVAPGTSFFELGGHSLLLIRLIGRIEATFGRRLSVAEVHANPTPRGVASLLASEGDAGQNLDHCIVEIQPHGTLPPIYGVHVLGVNGNYYRPLSRALGPDQPIFGLTVGLLDEFTPTGVAETAELYHQIIEKHQPCGPLSLVAVSLGSYVALELAQRLIADGRDVTMLAIMDAEGPGGRPRILRVARIKAHVRRLLQHPGAYIRAQTAHKLAEARHWVEKLKLVLSGRMGRPRAPTSSIEGFVAANELAVQAYRPRPYPRRLTIVRATDSIFDSDEAIASGLGWAPVAAGGFDLVEIPGDHLTIMEDPSVVELARELRSAIDKTRHLP